MTKGYKRVVLKISGEAFCKKGSRGVDIQETKTMAKEIFNASKYAQIAVVVGGGNIVRGLEIARDGVLPATGDYMGMLATVINALALQDVLENIGAPTRLLTAIQIHTVAEPFIRRRAMRHLEKGRIIILAAGTGSPHFTTDTAAALKAAEIKAETLLKATTWVDGVYDSDPLDNPKARKYSTISYLDVINKDLKIMDPTAITMCKEHKLPIVVFNLKKQGNLMKAIQRKNVGTIISGESSKLI